MSLNRFGLPTICILYLLLALIYSWATPPFESSDEYKHFPVVQHIHQTGELVFLDPDNVGKWKQEGAQPPLYYLLMAAATSWVDTADLDDVHVENRHAFIGNAAQVKNKNLVFHDPTAERFPWSGSILAVHVIRLLSIGLGLGTLWFGWLTANLFFDRQTALFVVALTAFNPMFLFISAAVNNDSLSVMLGSAGLFLLVKIWQAQSESQGANSGPLIDTLMLGVVCGLSMLTKLSLATLLLLAGFVTARGMFMAWRPPSKQTNWRALWVQTGRGLLTLAIALALVAPWLARNWRLYSDLTGLNAFIAVQGTRPDPTLGGVDWVAEFGTFFRSYWGLFGGVNVFAPQWFYTVCNLLFWVGLAGLLFKIKTLVFPSNSPSQSGEGQFLPHRGRLGEGIILPSLMVIITMILLIRWTIISPAFQGRLLFPALISVNLLWVLGLRTISGRWSVTPQKLPAVPLFATLFLFVMATIIPFSHIAPAYAYPQPVTVPAGAEFGPITYTDTNGESISLVGVEMEPGQTAYPNDQVGVAITLYWTTETGVSTDYVTAVHALGREYESVGQIDRHPGWGMWPPTRWQPGEIYADPYHVWVNPGNPNPALLRIDISVSDTSGPKSRILTATSPTGDLLDLAIVGHAKLGQTSDPNTANTTSVSVDFADFVTLSAISTLPEKISAGDTLPISLFWHANGTPNADYTVFLQLIDPDGVLVATGDQPPLNGDYPTSIWAAGERIEDQKTLQIPADAKPGTYQILIGLYDPITGNRMQRLDGGDSVTQSIEIAP